MKGQLSAEMIILAAVLLAVVAIVAISLTKTAQNASAKVTGEGESILNRTGEIAGNFSDAQHSPPIALSPAPEPFEA